MCTVCEMTIIMFFEDFSHKIFIQPNNGDIFCKESNHAQYHINFSVGVEEEVETGDLFLA